jgi:uncharacterized membrane protein
MPATHDPRMQWASGINIIAGIWLLISPWVLGFSAMTTARNDAVIFGIIVGVLAAVRLFAAPAAAWLSWVNLILGIWVFIAPWVLGFSGDSVALWDHLILGVIFFICGLVAATAMPRATT